MKIEVNVKKRYFISILAFLLVIGIIGIAYAFNSNPANPAVFGHSADEIAGLSDLVGGGNGSVLVKNSGNLNIPNTNAVSVSWEHGLGRKPDFVRVVLVSLVNQASSQGSYLTGDELEVSTSAYLASGGNYILLPTLLTDTHVILPHQWATYPLYLGSNRVGEYNTAFLIDRTKWNLKIYAGTFTSGAGVSEISDSCLWKSAGANSISENTFVNGGGTGACRFSASTLGLLYGSIVEQNNALVCYSPLHAVYSTQYTGGLIDYYACESSSGSSAFLSSGLPKAIICANEVHYLEVADKAGDDVRYRGLDGSYIVFKGDGSYKNNAGSQCPQTALSTQSVLS